MKLVQVTFQFQYAEAVEEILDARGVDRWVRIPMIHGRDRDGKHQGSQAFPGNVTLVEALVADQAVDPLLDDLADFRDEKRAHGHLDALVLQVERRLEPRDEEEDEEDKEETPGERTDTGGDG
ncbi:MAG: PG0541 family transporter-associated protein [Myxococcota bacterium]